MTSAATASDPHQSVQECVSLITSLHGQVYAVFVASRVDSIGHVSVDNLLQNVFGAGQPSFCADNDKRRWLINGLEDVIGAEVGGRIFGHDLCILTTGLFSKR
jgi:hypothetical protein